MNWNEDSELVEPERAEIMCRSCRRPLHALRVPRCNWCGMAVPNADYETVVSQSQRVMALPDFTPLPPISSYAQISDPRWRCQRSLDLLLPRTVQRFRPLTQGQARLRVAVITVFGILAVVKAAYLLYAIWEMHRLIQTLPQ
jgi:hypothetical protein